MDLGLLNYIDVDLKWNIVKKGRRTNSRRPRKPGSDSFRLGNDPSAFEAKKSADVLGGHFAEKVVDAPLKKRRLLRQSLSPSPQTPCLHGEGHLSPEPQTPSVHREDLSQRCHSNSLSLTRKAKSKSGSRSSKILKKTKKVDDFSGIELLAAAACSSFLDDNVKDHIEDLSVLKEQITPGVNSCNDDMKEAITSTAGSSSRDSMVPDTPILHDNGNEEGQKKVNPSKGLRLHWDLNTVMDEWEEPSLEGLNNGGLKGGHLNLEGCEEERFTEVEPSSHQLSEKHDVVLSVVPVIDKSNGDSFVKTYESFEDLMGTKKVTSKISDGESSASKSDVVDSLIHSDKCEGLSTSTTSVLREETIVVKCESDTTDNHLNHSDKKIVSEESMQEDGFPSPKLCVSYGDNKVGSDECCGSDVTQDEQGQMAEDDTTDKVQVGYDSPFEDGELREEPIGWEENEVSEKETVNYESDNTYKNDYGTIENEKIEASRDHGQSTEDQRSSLVKEAFKSDNCGSGKEVSGRKNVDNESKPLKGNSLHNDEPTSIDGCRNGAYIRRSRSSNIGDPYSSMRIHDYNRPRNGNLEPLVRSGGCRSLDGHQFRNYEPRGGGYTRPSPSERNNGGYGLLPRGPPPPVRSLSRDRYRGGPGFHHPQEYHERERKTRCFSPNFNRPTRRSRSRSRSVSPPIAWHFQKRRNLDTDDNNKPSNSSEIETFDDRRLIDNKRQSSTVAMIRRNQRIESIGYPERLKTDDHFRFTQQRSGRFSQQPIGPPHKYKDNNNSHYEKTRRFRYMADRNLDRDGHGGGMVISESKIEEKGRSSISRFSS